MDNLSNDNNVGTAARVVDKFYRPVDSPAYKNIGRVSGVEFNSRNEIQSRFALLSNINVKNFVIISGTASGTGAIGNGTTLYLSTTLVPDPPHQFDINYADPYLAVYQGTAADSAYQIYPTYGGSVTPGAYTVQGGLDFHGLGTSNPQTLSIWKGTITDNSAGNQTILFATVWKWLQYNAAAQSL